MTQSQREECDDILIQLRGIHDMNQLINLRKITDREGRAADIMEDLTMVQDTSSQTIDYLSKFCIVPVRDLVHFRYCAPLSLVISQRSPLAARRFCVSTMTTMLCCRLSRCVLSG